MGYGLRRDMKRGQWVCISDKITVRVERIGRESVGLVVKGPEDVKFLFFEPDGQPCRRRVVANNEPVEARRPLS